MSELHGTKMRERGSSIHRLRVVLKKGRYHLRRKRDGQGDSGPALSCFDWDKREDLDGNGELRVGFGVKCGSIMARMFGSDWWLTTPIDKIISVKENDKGEIVEAEFVTVNGSKYTVTVT